MPNEIDQIKERIGVAELIGEYLKLEKAGSNYKALCPFHNEKTPSFMVNPDRGFWYCFGCQKGGDVFTFVQEMEGVDFGEALKRLADKAGVELSRFQTAEKGGRSKKQTAFEITELAAKVFEHFLRNHPQSARIREYLKERKLTDELMEEFRIGYAPAGWKTLLKFLLKKGYSLDDIVTTGLVVQKADRVQSERDAYDRFRDRIMFPIIDVTGRVVGFSARVSPDANENGAKYINTPQTSIYDKSRVLYGLHQAKAAIRKEDFVVVVEGNVDVIASHLAGQKNAVAVSGTALTAAQVKLLKRYTDNIKLCFDMDEAGKRATKKSIRTCLLEGAEVEIILLPEGAKDTGDLVNDDPAQWRRAVSKAVPVMEYFFSQALSRLDPDNVKDKKNIAKELLNVIKDMADPIEQNYWIKKLSVTIGVEEEVLTGILEKVKVRERPDSAEREQEDSQTRPSGSAKSRLGILEERLLGLFSIYPRELSAEAKKIDPEEFGRATKKIWERVLKGDLKKYENELSRFAVSVKYQYDENQGFVENEIDCLSEWKTIRTEIKKEIKRSTLRKISLDIKKAQEEGDEEAVELLLKEFNKHAEQGS